MVGLQSLKVQADAEVEADQPEVDIGMRMVVIRTV